MALIKKIRERSGVAVGIVAIALLLFILGGDFLSGNSMLLGKQSSEVGEIAGRDISIEEFQNEVANLEQRYGGNVSEAQMDGLRNQAWESLIARYAFQNEFDELGVTVPNEEKREMIYGKNIDPSLRQAFTDPQTGEFNRQRMEEILGQYKSGNMPAQQRDQIKAFLDDIYRARLRLKYENLILNTAYVTKEEARQEYLNQTSKAEVKYLYIPFYSVNDSTVKVSDDEIKAYIEKNKEKYKAEETASIEYISFPVVASKEDSQEVRKEIDELAAEFKTVTDDSTFARINSEGENAFLSVNPGELPPAIAPSIGGLQKGDVVGPLLENGSYKLFKLSDIKQDTAFSAKASHILIKPASPSAEDEQKALQQANDILNQIKGGASFESMAMVHGTDGTRNSGGDLGWFSKGRMVPEFENAVFGFSGTGLLPQPVKTQFGYHIIKVTEPKTNVKYRVAVIEKQITPSSTTNEAAYKRASTFALNAKDSESFKANAAKENITIMQAPRVGIADRSINELTNTRAIVRWIFNDGKVGNVSEVFELENRYVVAVIKGKYEKGTAHPDNVRDEVSPKIKNEKKAEQIIAKLKGAKGSLEDIAQKYGPSANVFNQADLTFGSSSLSNVGFAPVTTGRVFGMKKGKRSEPIIDENGILIVEVINTTPAPEIADYSMYKDQLVQRRKSQAGYSISEAVKKFADIKDERTKHF